MYKTILYEKAKIKGFFIIFIRLPKTNADR